MPLVNARLSIYATALVYSTEIADLVDAETRGEIRFGLADVELLEELLPLANVALPNHVVS